MTIEEIKELIQLFTESGVAELDVQRGENRVRLRRASIKQEVIVPTVTHAPIIAAAPAPVTPIASPAVVSNPPAAAAATASPAPTATRAEQPIVDDAPAPGAPPFVRLGDRVEPGQVLCIIESMKLRNEIESEVAGTVAAKLVENGRPVEYGEALFAVLPH